MNKQFTANEVRTESCKQGQLHRQPASDMLNAFADLLEAREKAVPVVWVNPEDLANPYFVGIVFKRGKKFLHFSERQTHTGSHLDFEWVADVNDATVYYGAHGLVLEAIMRETKGAQKISAIEKRTVSLQPNNQVERPR